MSSRPSDPAGGVKVMTIAGPMASRRLRCLGMTDQERRWRAQFLKDQVLSHEEPRDVPEYYKATVNIFRRLWKTPFWKFQKALEPTIGKSAAFLTRHAVGKLAVIIAGTYAAVYFFKYHSNDFTRSRPVEFHKARPIMFPDDPDYPNVPEKQPSDYYDQGFYSSVLCQDVEIEEPPPPPPPPPTRSEEDERKCAALTQEED